MKCSSPGGGLAVIKPTHCDVVPFRLRNVEKTSDFDPVTKRQVFRRKESSQWEHPAGPNEFHQYSKVLDEKSTFAPSVHQKEQGTFEYLTSKCGDTNTRAIRSEQKFQEVRHLSDGGGITRKSASTRLVTTVQSFSSTTTTKYSKGLLQDVTTVSDLEFCPPSTTLNGNLSCVHSNGNNCRKKDWELDFASLEENTQRLDNSVQIEKKNLSKNGSLSRRRPPTRSNLKSIMSEFFNNGEEILKQDKVNGTSNIFYNKNNEETFVREKEPAKPVVTSVNSNKNAKASFKTSKEVLIQKSFEIPKEVELILFDAKQQKQRTILHKEEETTSCNWLREAKEKLRKCQSSLPIEVNGHASSIVSSTKTSNINNILKNEQKQEQRNIEHYSVNSSQLFEMNGHGTNSNSEYEPKNCNESSNRWLEENSEYNENSEFNGNIVTTTSEVEHYDYPDIHQNISNDSKEKTGSELFGYGSDSDSEECATVVENFSLSSVLRKPHVEGCVIGVHLDDDEPERPLEPSPPPPPVIVTSLLEKNKSKSTSNLDDDETMEAPWFQHPTYQKPSRVVDEMREFAKSSADLKCGSSERVSEMHRVRLRSRPIPEESGVNSSWSEEEEESSEQKAPWMQEVKLKSVSPNVRREKLSPEPVTKRDNFLSVTRNAGTVTSSDMAQNVSEVTVNGGPVTFSIGTGSTHSPPRTCSELYSNSWSSMCHDNVVIIANNENNNEEETLGHKWVSEGRSKDTILSNTLNSDCSPRKTRLGEFATKINVSGLHVRPPDGESVQWESQSSDRCRKLTTNVTGPQQVKLRKVVTQSTAEMSENRNYGVRSTNRLCVSSPIYSMGFNEESDDDERRSSLDREMRWMHQNGSKKVSNTNDDIGGGHLFKYRLKTFSENNDLDQSLFRTNGNEEVTVTGNSVDASTWQKLVKLEQKKTTKSNDGQQPLWIKEAEEKTKSWRNLTALESPQHSASTGSRASWLEEVKLKRTDTPTVDVETDSEGWSPVPPHPTPDVDTEDFGTSWKFVRLKPTDKNRVNGGHLDVEEPESEESQAMTIEDTSIDDDTSEDLSTSMKSSDQSQLETCDSSRRSTPILPKEVETRQSQFDVEGYVKELISRRRANKDVQRPTINSNEQQSENSEWLQIFKEKSKNVDWNSLEKLTGTKKVDRSKNCQLAWSRTEKCFSSDDEEAVATDEIEGKSRSRKTGNNSSLKSPSSSVWVSQVQLNSCGSTVRVSGGDFMSTKDQIGKPHREKNSIMSDLITNGSKTEKSERETDWSNMNRKKNEHKEKSSKRVTFDIPKARSSPDLQRRHEEGSPQGDYPEWVKIAERKCNKEINWECFDNKQETSSKLTSENKWITQVQLRHVNTKSTDETPKTVIVESEPQKLNTIVTVNGQHHGDSLSSVEDEDFDNAGTETSDVLLHTSSPDWLKVAERKKQARIKWEQFDSSSNDEEIQDGSSSTVEVSPVLTKLNGLENGVTKNTSRDWHSGDLEVDLSLPSWLHVAEKKKKSSIDWTNIERDISIKTSSSSKVKWIQQTNLRSTSESSICDDKLYENPFHVSLRHVQHEEVPSSSEDTEEVTSDVANITWPTRNGGSDIDRWQVLYKDLFEDLLDDSVRLSHSESTDELGATSETKNRKSKKLISTLESRQRKRIDLRQHRYYSLPEISCALPRDDHEVEIIQLPIVEDSKLEENKLDTTTNEINFTEENEEKPIVFVKLRPIDRKKNDQIVLHEEEEESWFSRIKLRNTLIATTMEESEASTSGYSKRTSKSLSLVPLKPLSGTKYSGFTRTRMCSSPSTATRPLQSIREAIHRDIKKEVARRENKKPIEVPQPPPQKKVATSPAKESAAETTEQGMGFSPPSKPKWLVELQQKKETQRRAFLSEAPNGSSVATVPAKKRGTKDHLQLSSSPPFISVIDQIKSMGKEKLFANLRKCPLEVTTSTLVPLDEENSKKSFEATTTLKIKTETTGCSSKQTLIRDDKNSGSAINGNMKCGSLLGSRSDSSTTMETFCGSIVDIVHHPVNFSSDSTCVITRTASDVSVAMNGDAATKKPSKNTTAKEEEASKYNNNNKSAPLMLKKHFECQLTSAKQLVNGTKDTVGINLKQRCSSNMTHAQMYSVSSKWRASITNNGSLQQEIVIKNNTRGRDKSPEESRKERRRNTIELVSTSSVSEFGHRETAKHSASFDDELKSPLLLMNLMSRLNKSCSDTNLNVAGIHNQSKNNGKKSTEAAADTSSSKSRRAATSCSDLSCSVKPSTITVKTFDSIGSEQSLKQMSSYRSEMSFSVDVPEDTVLILDAKECAPIAEHSETRIVVDKNDFDLKLTTKCVYGRNMDENGKASNGVAKPKQNGRENANCKWRPDSTDDQLFDENE